MKTAARVARVYRDRVVPVLVLALSLAWILDRLG